MGYEVHVLANEYPGGKLSSFKLGDYRFDAGPPLFTMLSMLMNYFIYLMKILEIFLTTKKKLFVNTLARWELTALQIKINFLKK